MGCVGGSESAVGARHGSGLHVRPVRLVSTHPALRPRRRDADPRPPQLLAAFGARSLPLPQEAPPVRDLIPLCGLGAATPIHARPSFSRPSERGRSPSPKKHLRCGICVRARGTSGAGSVRACVRARSLPLPQEAPPVRDLRSPGEVTQEKRPGFSGPFQGSTCARAAGFADYIMDRQYRPWPHPASAETRPADTRCQSSHRPEPYTQAGTGRRCRPDPR